MVSCYEQQNNYQIHNYTNNERMQGKSYFEAQETTSLCSRLCCGENRGFAFKLTSNVQNKVKLQFERAYRCCGCAIIPGCAHKVAIKDEEDETVGQVRVNPCSFITPDYIMEEKNAKTGKMEKIGHITRKNFCPCLICDFCGSRFDILDANEKPVGKLEKLAPANIREALLECYTEADTYVVDFRAAQDKAEWEKDLDISTSLRHAALATVFQIDFNFFEDKRGPCEGHCCDIYCCGYAVPCVPCCFLAVCGTACALCCGKENVPGCCGGNRKKRNVAAPNGSPEQQVMSV